MQVSIINSKNNIKIRNKISGIDILKIGKRVEDKYNFLLKNYNYELSKNIHFYAGKNINVRIISINYNTADVVIMMDTIYKTIVVNVWDRDNIYIKEPKCLRDDKDRKTRVILASIGDTLYELYTLSLRFKSFKTDAFKLTDIKSRYVIEITSKGIYLYDKITDKCIVSILYENVAIDKNGKVILTNDNIRLLKRIYFKLSMIPQWIKEEI